MEIFFRECLSKECVVETNIRVATPTLQKTLKARESLIFEIECVLALEARENRNGRTIRSRQDVLSMIKKWVDIKKVRSLEGTFVEGLLGGPLCLLLLTRLFHCVIEYADRLRSLNEKVCQQIDEIDKRKKAILYQPDVDLMSQVFSFENAESLAAVSPRSWDTNPDMEVDAWQRYSKDQDDDCDSENENEEEQEANDASPTRGLPHMASRALRKAGEAGTDLITKGATKVADAAVKSGRQVADVAVKGGKGAAGKVVSVATDGVHVANAIASHAINFVGFGNDDGKAFSSGFVTFSNLTATYTARQMLHDSSPFAMEVEEAPDHNDGMYAWC